MAKFLLNWNLDGFRDKLHEAGEIIEAELEEVAEFVEEKFGGKQKPGAAVLTPVTAAEAAALESSQTDDAGGSVDHASVDLNKLKKDELIAHAKLNHGLDLDTKLKNVEMVEAIEAARKKPTDTPEGEPTPA